MPPKKNIKKKECVSAMSSTNCDKGRVTRASSKRAAATSTSHEDIKPLETLSQIEIADPPEISLPHSFSQAVIDNNPTYYNNIKKENNYEDYYNSQQHSRKEEPCDQTHNVLPTDTSKSILMAKQEVLSENIVEPVSSTSGTKILQQTLASSETLEPPLNLDTSTTTCIASQPSINSESPSKMERVPQPDPEKQKRLNAELQRLAQEISFENTLKPVRIQQVQAFNPFKQFTSTTADAGKPAETDWANLAKLWMQSGEQTNKVTEQLSEIEKQRKEENERMEQEKSKQQQIEIQKKKEAALALAQKLVNESQRKIEEEKRKVQQDHSQEKMPHTISPIIKTEPIEAASINKTSFSEDAESVEHGYLSSRISRYRRSHSRSSSSSTKSRSRSGSRSIGRRRSRSRDFHAERKRSRSRDLGRYGRHNGHPKDRRESGYSRWKEDRHNRSYRDSHRKDYKRSRSPQRRQDYRRFTRGSPSGRSRRSNSPIRKDPIEESSFEEQKIEAMVAENVSYTTQEYHFEKKEAREIPSVPLFEEIDELIYLDDKLTKFGKKVKRPVEKSVQCDCYYKGLSCSDNRCLNREMLFECRKCKALSCQNQRFRKRQYAPVEPFYTGPQKGFGVRATDFIKKGTFIIEYVGEVVTAEEFSERAKRYAKDPNHTHHYIFELGQKLIDATKKGNCSRFINHSCEPNAVCLKWAVPKSPKDISRIGFFASRDIVVGEEITFDYQFIVYGKQAQLCHCGAPSCKGVIGQTIDEEEEDDDDDDELDEEEESDDDNQTEEDRLRKYHEAEIKEWESQKRINEIISTGNIPAGKRNICATKLVKNLIRVDEINYKLRILSWLEHTDFGFMQVLKRKCLYDVFASWLSPSDWSRADMELKIEVIRLMSNQEGQDSAIDQVSGWTDFCCKAVEELANADIPLVLGVRDAVEFCMDQICGQEDEDEDEVGNEYKGLTNEEIFVKVKEAASSLSTSKRFSEQKKRCAISKFKIPKKLKQEREAAAENPASTYQSKTTVERSGRRGYDYYRNGRGRFSRYENYYDRNSSKRRYDSSSYYHRNKHFEPDYKRNRYSHDYHRKNDRSDRYERTSYDRNYSKEGPRTPIFEESEKKTFSAVVDQPSGWSGNQPPPPGLVVPKPKLQLVVADMEVSDGTPSTPKTPKTPPMPTSGQQNIQPPFIPPLRLDVSASTSCGPRTFGSQHSGYSIDYPHAMNMLPHSSVPGFDGMQHWAITKNRAYLYNHFSAFPKETRRMYLDYFNECIGVIYEIEKDIKEREEAEAKASFENMQKVAELAKLMQNSASIPVTQPPPPPPKKQTNFYRIRNADGEDPPFYYWRKNTHDVVWDLPEGETFEDFEGAQQPDSSADVEGSAVVDETVDGYIYRPTSRSSLHRPDSRSSICPPSQSQSYSSFDAGIQNSEEIIDPKLNHSLSSHNLSSETPQSISRSHSHDHQRKKFRDHIENFCKPIMWYYLEKILSADTERRNWLLKQVTKEMFKRETSRADCTMIITKDVKKRVGKYVKAYMERKCVNDGQDLFSGFEKIRSAT